MATISDWTLLGAAGKPIRGTTHLPDADAAGAVIFMHGFKGYKDYGFLPHVGATLAAAGWIVHRVSASHSGMGHGHGDFDETLFRADTWSRTVEDLQFLASAVDRGVLAGDGRGTVLMGHSRGGAAVLTAAGRHAGDGSLGALRGVVSLSAPARLNGLDEAAAATLLETGVLDSPSSRTGQALQVGAAWLQEQLDDPAGHDLPALMNAVHAPMLLVHGADDLTVPASNAVTLAQCAPDRVQVYLVEGADHVFNTPNPFAMTAAASNELADAEQAILGFLATLPTV